MLHLNPDLGLLRPPFSLLFPPSFLVCFVSPYFGLTVQTRQELVAGDGRKADRKDHQQQNVLSEEESIMPSRAGDEVLLSKGLTREKPAVSSDSSGVALVNPGVSGVDTSYV